MTNGSLSGNPPFYDDAEDDDPDNRDKNLFLKILSGDYEFDSPYWDDISDSGKITAVSQVVPLTLTHQAGGLMLSPVSAAKTLVTSLMEVDQDQRLTAQEAIAHEW